MSSYLNNDGSGLIGALNPSSVGQALQVDNVGSLKVINGTSATATLTSVAGSVTSVAILAANINRKGVTIYNDSASAMYLAYAVTATTSAFTVKIPANYLYEMPNLYTGALSALWDVATGSARITEGV